MSDATMMKLILDSQALSIWNNQTGPVFWYAAGVPGPFYLNTEVMIGRNASEKLLAGITAIVAETALAAERAERLEKLIFDEYATNKDYNDIINALASAATAFDLNTLQAISGGERRDWLFSLPLAHKLNLPHLYLFKNGTTHCAATLPAKAKILHVSDLINNAASYFDMWLPMLQKADMRFAGTLTVNIRGNNGIKRLEDAGYKLAALNHIDAAFFDRAAAEGLIAATVRDEIRAFFTSPQQWGERYLMRDATLYGIDTLDAKSLERMRSFFETDPWQLERAHKAFFATMRSAIAARKAA